MKKRNTTSDPAGQAANLVTNGKQKGLLVLNPVAGSGRPEEVRRTVRTTLAEIAYDVYETTGKETLHQVVRKAVRENEYGWVAAAGGDGTVSEVANGLLGSHVPLAIIPAGTGNALAHELGIPQDTGAACRLLLNEPALCDIDGIEVDGKLFFLKVGLGLGSVVMKITSSEQKNRWGFLAYLMNAVKRSFGWQPFRFTLTVDEQRHELKASELVIVNASKVGFLGLDWRSDISPVDGRLDIGVMRARSLVDYARVVWTMLWRRRRQPDHVQFFSAYDRLHVALNRPLLIHGDGELVGERAELTATVVPQALTVVVPANGRTSAAAAPEAAGEPDPQAGAKPSLFDNLRYLVTRTFKEWREDNASRLAAALSYYTVFSLPPLLVLSLAIAGLFYDQQAAQEQLLGQAQGILGETGSQALTEILENASDPALSSLASVVSIVLLFFGASGVFAQLQEAMNTIWEVQSKPGRGILGTIKDRILSFTMVLSVGFVLLVSLVLSAILAAVGEFINGLAPDVLGLARAVSFVISFGGIALLLALIFKTVPDVKIGWRDVWLGAVVTALLFNFGKWAIGLYLGQSAPASTYGAAGSLIVVLLWVYYSAQILFLGAEFTQVYATRFGNKIVADANAVPIPGADHVEPDTAAPG